MSGYEMLGRDDHVTAAAEVIEVGLVRIVDQAGGTLLPVLVGAVKRDDGRELAVPFERDAEIGMGAFVGLDVVADQPTGVLTIDHDFFVNPQIERRFLRFVTVPDEVEIALAQHLLVGFPVRGSLHTVEQVIPRGRDGWCV